MRLVDDAHYINENDSFAIAFLCNSGDEARNQAVQASVSLVLAFADDRVEGANNGDPWWPGCSGGRALGANELANCAETLGQDAFVGLPVLRVWSMGFWNFPNDGYSLAIALKRMEGGTP
jgi:hypothetical protein